MRKNIEAVADIDEVQDGFQAESFEDYYSEDDITLDHIPDIAECRQIRKQMDAKKFWPNVFHVNDHGNVDLLAIGYNGAKIVKSWV